MTGQPAEITIKPIGIVKSKVKQKTKPEYNWQEVVSEIVLDSSLTEALEGLERYSHIIVLYWLHQAVEPDRMAIKVRPRSKPELPMVGLFASRSPYRPNPLGQKVVRFLGRKDNVLRVAGLDAIDKTPVIDIKPYIPGYDSADDATAPQWTGSK